MTKTPKKFAVTVDEHMLVKYTRYKYYDMPEGMELPDNWDDLDTDARYGWINNNCHFRSDYAEEDTDSECIHDEGTLIETDWDAPRQQTCAKCDVVMIDDWNLAPIEGDKITIKETDQHGNTYLIERDAERIYKDNVYLCDECYDHWCTKQNIQPLEGE